MHYTGDFACIKSLYKKQPDYKYKKIILKIRSTSMQIPNIDSNGNVDFYINANCNVLRQMAVMQM